MLADQARLSRHVPGALVTALLLVALLGGLPADGVQLLHSHGGGNAAVYNGNCPLAAVGACHNVGLPVVPAPPTPMLLPGSVAELAQGARPFTPVAPHTDPRAPPLV